MDTAQTKPVLLSPAAFVGCQCRSRESMLTVRVDVTSQEPTGQQRMLGKYENDQVVEFPAPAAQHGGRGWGPAAVLRRRRGKFLYGLRKGLLADSRFLLLHCIQKPSQPTVFPYIALHSARFSIARF